MLNDAPSLNNAPSLADCDRLTVIPGKLQQYCAEPEGFLRSGLECLGRMSVKAPSWMLSRLAVLVLQPDLIAGRLTEKCVSYLLAHGFRPVHALGFRFSLPMCDAVWKFQSNVISRDSMAIREAIYCHGTSIMLLLEDVGRVAGLPASSRLTELKGSSNPASRDGMSLRSELGAFNRVFGFVHCPDEPLDIIRELAIMLTAEEQLDTYRKVAQAFSNGFDYDCQTLVREVYREIPEHDINPGRARLRLLEKIADTGAGNGSAERLKTLIAGDSGRPRVALDWFSFARCLREINIDPAGWDPMIVASGLVQNEIPGKVKHIPNFSEAAAQAVKGNRNGNR